jgi:hypothetical protein
MSADETSTAPIETPAPAPAPAPAPEPVVASPSKKVSAAAEEKVSDSDSDDDFEQTTKVPILNANPVTGGKRERKTVERLETTVVEKAEFSIVPGSGDLIGDISYACEMLTKQKPDSVLLKTLHSCLYGKPGKASTIRKNIRGWSGIHESADEEAVSDKMYDKLDKLKLADVTGMMDMLDVDRSGKNGKDERIECLVNWLCKPDASKCKHHGKASKPVAKKRVRRCCAFHLLCSLTRSLLLLTHTLHRLLPRHRLLLLRNPSRLRSLSTKTNRQKTRWTRTSPRRTTHLTMLTMSSKHV